MQREKRAEAKISASADKVSFFKWVFTPSWKRILYKRIHTWEATHLFADTIKQIQGGELRLYRVATS